MTDGVSSETWRLLTIAFIDLVGSTPLSLTLDGEDYAEVIDGYWRTVMPIVHRHRGHTGDEEGDGRLIWFGWPRAAPDDARRAVRMALEIRAALDESAAQYKRRFGIDFKARIGIHTGETIVRTVGGSTPRFMGSAVNLAAKVQSAATEGTVCISAATSQLLDDRFPLEPTGRLSIGELDGDIELYTVVGEERDDADRLVGSVSRAAEEAWLDTAWQRVTDGDTASVLIVGEGGIGKTSLVNRFLHEQAGVTPWLSVQGDPYRQDESFGALSQAVPEVPHDADERERFMHDLIDDIGRAGAEAPTIVLVEDAHWLDHSTGEMVSRLVAARHPGVLVLATSRLAALANDAEHPLQTITLGPLSESELSAVASDIAPDLNDEQLANVAHRAGGNPLFAEVLARAIIEQGDEDTHPALIPHSEVPIVVQQALRSQLDGSRSAADLCSTAAVIGMDFSVDLLQASHPRPGDVERDLDWLEARRVIARTREAGAFRFRHALVRQVSYDLLVRSGRQVRHGLVADTLAASGGASKAVLGMHYERAGRLVEAVTAKVEAAAEARSAGAFREGVDLADQALELMDRYEVDGTDAEVLRSLEARALEQRSIMVAAFERRGYVAGAMDRDRLNTILDVDADGSASVRALTREWAGCMVMGNLGPGASLLRRMWHLGRSDEVSSAVIRMFRGTHMMYRGNFGYAEPILRDAAMSLAEFGLQPDYRANWSTTDDPVSTGLSRLPPLLWIRGEYQQALEMLDLAETEAATLAGPAGAANAAHVMANSALFFEQAGQGERAVDLGRRIVEVGSEPALAFWEDIGKLHQLIGAVMVASDGGAAGQLHDAARSLESVARLFAPMVYLVSADAHLRAGEPDKTLDAVDGAKTIATTTGARWLWSESCRLGARASSDDDVADGLLEEAIRTARRQGARVYEARSIIDLLQRRPEAEIDGVPVRGRATELLAELPDADDYVETEQLGSLLG